MKKLLIFTVTAAMLLSLAACTQSAKPDVQPEQPKQEETISDNTQIPNPWTDYASAAEAAQAAGFDLTAPDEISGVSEKRYQVMNSEDGDVIFEIDYVSGEERAAYVHKAPGADDVSGDYNNYAETETVSIGSRSVTMKGEDALVKLAVWTAGDYSYALNVTAGLSQDAMAALVAEIQ